MVNVVVATQPQVLGDIVHCYFYPPSVRAQVHLAIHPTKIIYNPVTGKINGSIELPESVYFITYKALEPAPDIKDNIIRDKSLLKAYKPDKRFKYN